MMVYWIGHRHSTPNVADSLGHGRPLLRPGRAAFGLIEGQQRVGHSQSIPGAERRLYGLYLSFTTRWLLCLMQRPLGRIASTPAVGQLLPFMPYKTQVENDRSRSAADVARCRVGTEAPTGSSTADICPSHLDGSCV
jgi:hypothetical protein